MNIFEYALDIPFTVWRRGDGDPNTSSAQIRKGKNSFVFDGIPVNPFGETKTHEFNKSFSVNGYSGTVLYAKYKDNQIYLYVRITGLPSEGQMATAVPIALILGGIIAIVGLGLLIALLAKIQTIFELPIFPMILVIVLLIVIVKLLQVIGRKKKGR